LTDPLQAESLVERFKSGDLDSFTELVKITFPKTYSLAYRLVQNEDDAADISQEVYLRVFKSLRKFRGDSSFESWIYRITTNCAYSLLAKKHSLPILTDNNEKIESCVVDGSYQDEIHIGFAFTRDAVNHALAKIKPSHRAVIVLRDVYGFSHDEIAKYLKISKTTSKVRLHRARSELKEILKRRVTNGEINAV